MLTSSSGSPAHWSMHDSEGVSLSATEVADTFDLFARVEGELVNLNRENRKRGLPDVSYQAGLEQLEAEYGFHFDPDKQNELNWHQALKIEKRRSALETLLSLRAYEEEPYTEFRDERGWSSYDQIISGGYGELINALADGLDVRVNTPATQISYGDDGVKVYTTDGGYVYGSAVVVTVPLGVLQEEQKLSFDPKLSKEKMEAVGSLEMGPMIKLTMKFATRFWERGTYCWGMMADERGEWPEYFVTSMEGHTDENIMFAYIAGKYSLALIDTPDSNVQAAALRKLRVIFPGGVDNPVASVVNRWGPGNYSEYFGGAFTYVPVNSSSSHMATLSKPAGGGRVLFAGEATCPLLYGATSWRVVSVFAIQSMMPNNSLLNIGCSSWGDIILM
ncbi:hypothetical protein CYMTET_34125 [Cymbomonas tetramitiformis]|uniref:Amine oxidase domain-containing protein n=1 Tax=Cymbomonas tetramitiformis TaxID=36881 RepID=A0AAE0FBV5_9CHLO|nr:hypothetical protein CYMTET_34125 [Cymbomonas tetramitiformis]